MKKSLFLIFSVAALTLCACNNGNNNKPNKDDSGPYATPTMDVAFEKISDTCMVPSHVKEYVDAMHEQEASIQYPHRVDSLYCNMSMRTRAAGGRPFALAK